MNRIPFRGGPQVVQEMVAGRVDFYVSPTIAIVPQYRDKQLKILAVTAPERLKSLADVPTLKEKGIDFVRFGWLGICAGAGTPQPIIDLLHRNIVTIVATPEYRELIEKARLAARYRRRRPSWDKSSHRRWTRSAPQSANSACSRNRAWPRKVADFSDKIMRRERA